MRRRRIRTTDEQDAFTGWRRLYTRFQRPGAAKKVKRAASRYERHVEARRDVAEGRADRWS